MPVKLFYGADSWSVEEGAKQWLRSHEISAIRPFAASSIADKTSPLVHVIQQDTTLFGPAEGVWIRNVTNVQARSLATLLPLARVPVAISAGNLDKKSALLKTIREHKAYGPPSTHSLLTLTRTLLKPLDLNDERLHHIVNYLPVDTGEAYARLRMLCLCAAANNNTASDELISTLICDEHTNDVFALTEAVLHKDTAKTAHLLTHLNEKPSIKLLRLLAMSFDQINTIRLHLDSHSFHNGLYRTMRPPIPVFKQGERLKLTKDHWTAERLKKAINFLLEAEIAIKKGSNPIAETGMTLLCITKIA